jgi:hypothetical protein
VKYGGTMKVTQTRTIEKRVVDIYEKSIAKESDAEKETAQRLIDQIRYAFRLIDIFDDSNHLQIIEKLYFCKENILKLNLHRMADKVFVQERTLFFYRQKYCKVFKEILS